MSPPCRTVEIMTSYGPSIFDYVISTPKETSAKTIDAALPTVLLLHTVYFGKDMFHHQFADPSLRRFNLVTVDLLCHGGTVGDVPEDYDQKLAATLIADFMDAISLPPCTVVGLAMGAMFAMQLAVSYPERVTSLFLISPLCTPELPDVAEGRQQIADAWTGSFDPISSADVVDRESLDDAAFGVLQLGFNSHKTSYIQAITSIAISQAVGQQAVQPGGGCVRATCTVCTERTGYADAELSPLAQARMPIVLVHGSEDVAYPPEYYAQFAEQLERCGANVRLHEVYGAPHYASATHYAEINPLIVLHVLDAWDGDEQPPAHAIGVTSPFEPALRAAGWRGDREEDSDEE